MDPQQQSHRDTLDRHLAELEAIARPGPDGVRWSHHERGSRSGTHVVLGVMVHGNECGTLPAAVRLIEALRGGEVAWTGPVTLFVGNPEAGRADQRYLDFDLNRAWDFSVERTGREPDRARELRPLIDRADLFLDLHQTLLPTESAFWTFPWDPVFGRWARVLQAAPVGLTRAPDQAYATEGLRCIDEYVRDRGRPGFTVELGQRGFDADQEENAFRTMKTLLEVQERIDLGRTTLAEEAARQPPIRWYTTLWTEPWGDPARALRPGLSNWSAVRAGEDLAAPGSPPVVAPEDGVLLFPQYPPAGAERPSHIFRLGRLLEHDPEIEFES